MSVKIIDNGVKKKISGFVVPDKATESQLGVVQVSDLKTITSKDSGFVLSATEKNPNVEGSIASDIKSLNTDLATKANASDLDSKANKADVDILDYLKSVVKEYNCGNVPAGGTLIIPKSLWGGSASPYMFFLKTSNYGGNYNNLSALIIYQYTNMYEYGFNVVAKTDQRNKFTLSLDISTGNIKVETDDTSTSSPNSCWRTFTCSLKTNSF